MIQAIFRKRYDLVDAFIVAFLTRALILSEWWAALGIFFLGYLVKFLLHIAFDPRDSIGAKPTKRDRD